ncbi:MAG: hypothetical protein EA411_06605 [Saprospirales bacterium]|nr:MAG: hypothetical protein EA411_06605 [Saprospirales bacterium]
MKLLIVTVVTYYQKEVLKLFKDVGIEAFSSSEIEGHKKSGDLVAAQSWFPGVKGGHESLMFFSFTTEERADAFFDKAAEKNRNLESANPIRAVVVNIEKSLEVNNHSKS